MPIIQRYEAVTALNALEISDDCEIEGLLPLVAQRQGAPGFKMPAKIDRQYRRLVLEYYPSDFAKVLRVSRAIEVLRQYFEPPTDASVETCVGQLLMDSADLKFIFDFFEEEETPVVFSRNVDDFFGFWREYRKFIRIPFSALPCFESTHPYYISNHCFDFGPYEAGDSAVEYHYTNLKAANFPQDVIGYPYYHHMKADTIKRAAHEVLPFLHFLCTYDRYDKAFGETKHMYRELLKLIVFNEYKSFNWLALYALWKCIEGRGVRVYQTLLDVFPQVDYDQRLQKQQAKIEYHTKKALNCLWHILETQSSILEDSGDSFVQIKAMLNKRKPSLEAYKQIVSFARAVVGDAPSSGATPSLGAAPSQPNFNYRLKTAREFYLFIMHTASESYVGMDSTELLICFIRDSIPGVLKKLPVEYEVGVDMFLQLLQAYFFDEREHFKRDFNVAKTDLRLLLQQFSLNALMNPPMRSSTDGQVTLGRLIRELEEIDSMDKIPWLWLD